MKTGTWQAENNTTSEAKDKLEKLVDPKGVENYAFAAPTNPSSASLTLTFDLWPLAQQYTSPIPGLRIGPACEADLSAGIHPVEERKKTTILADLGGQGGHAPSRGQKFHEIQP